MTEQSETRYGWVMVGVVFTLTALSFGAATSISVFLKPLTEEFGWTRSETSLAYTTVALASASFGVIWGYVADRFGTRFFGYVAALMMSLCLYLLSEQTSLWQFYLFYFIFGAFGNAMVSSPLFANVGFWFKSNPGLALGVTASGGAVGQGILPFLAGLAIEKYGWQQAYELMAVGYLALSLPLAFMIREPASREAARALRNSRNKGEQKGWEDIDNDLKDQRKLPLSEIEVVAWISCAAIFCCNCMSVPIVHLVPLLMDSGREPQVAASVLLVLMLTGGIGRIAGGKLCDMIGALPGYMVMSIGQTFFVFWFPLTENLAALYLLAVFFGFTYSGVMSAILVCNRTMVSAGFAARAMSITSFFGWTGMGMGGFFGGLFFDYFQTYFWSYTFASVAGIANLFVLFLFHLRIQAARQSAGLAPVV